MELAVVDGREAGTGGAMHIAIDLGAGSGRALVGGAGAGGFALREVHRFRYAPRQAGGHLRWDASSLLDGIRAGLRLACSAAADEGSSVASVGVDSWGVDYALLDIEGRLVEEPICYRDSRTARAMDEVFAVVPRGEIFARTGIQFQVFNTLYQLWSHVRDGLSDRARHLLLMPDFCHHYLCGSIVAERTNASTTQLLNAGTSRWDDWLFERLGLPRRLMADVVDAGTALGALRPELCAELGIPSMRVVAPGTHDTASAVAGTPLAPGWAYVSSGTWSLVGVERSEPLLSAEACQASLTNEAGVFGTVRLLTNVMGLWLLESCRREWEAEGRPQELSPLLAAVAQVTGSSGCRLCGRSPLLRAGEHGARAAVRAGRDRPGRHRRPGPPDESHPRLARLAVRRSGGQHRTSHRPAHPRHPHRRRRVAERLSEPGDGGRVGQRGAGRACGSHGHRQSTRAGRRRGIDRVAGRGTPPRGRVASAGPVRAA